LSELIASFNNLSDFFTHILEEGRSLYEEAKIPARPALLVHSSLSAFGYVPDGERTVVRALEAVRRKNKLTIVMPAHQDSREDDPENAFTDLVRGVAEEGFGGKDATTSPEDRADADKTDADNETIALSGGAASRLRPGMANDRTGETLAQNSDRANGIRSNNFDAGSETQHLSGERLEAGKGTNCLSGERFDAGSMTQRFSGEMPEATAKDSGQTEYPAGKTTTTGWISPDRTSYPAHAKNRWSAGYSVDPRKIPCLGMGRIADEFRRTRGVRRSGHPALSFCAKGPLARDILSGHRRATGLGPASPLGELDRRDALVLMLGTDWSTCTALHLAEYEIARRIEAAGGTVDRVTCRARSGKRGEWEIWEDIAYRTDLFPEIGRAFETAEGSRIRRGTIAASGRVWRLFRARDIVEFSIDRCGVLR
jgi:aminoglycoside N3'-acetyltransferase